MTTQPSIVSSEIESIVLLRLRPLITHFYVFPFIFAYPLAAYAYFVEYDRYLRSVDGESQEWTFLLCVTVFGGHALSWLATKWSTTIRQLATCYRVRRIEAADIVKVIPKPNKGKAAFCPIQRSQRTIIDPKSGKPENEKETILFIEYQRDHYFYSPATSSFGLLAYPSDSKPPLSTFTESVGIDSESQLSLTQEMYGKNTFDIPVPTFFELLGEHMQAPFFVFQMFSVGLWFLDEYWYYSLFTLFMLIVFECTTVFQRLRTLNEFRTMSIKPYLIQVYRFGKWIEVMSDQLVPGDLVSVLRTKEDSGVPCDLLLLRGTCIASEAMLSGESTPLLKESVELRSPEDRLDVLGEDRNSCLFGGTKILQVTPPENTTKSFKQRIHTTPDGGCLALVLRTGFGTTQGQLVRTMIFATEQVTANNLESFLFLAFLMLFAIVASRYVWVKGVERNLKRSKLLLDCVIIMTSVVPPELPMELSMAVNASLVALSKFAIFCTEPFRIPSAGRVDVCCFDKTGTITGEDLMVEGVVGVDEKDLLRLVPLNQTSFETTITLASAHALVLLEDGVIGDPMEKTTIDAVGWNVNKGDTILPVSNECPHRASITIQRRFQFSSLLKRMSTVSTVLTPNRQSRTIAAVKGAPEVIKKMIMDVPSHYESTYKYYTRRGSRVLTLAYKFMNISGAKINDLNREQVESDLIFAGFLVFTCPLKPDAVQTLKMLADSSHRCVMITGDNPLTAVHVAREVEIVDRDCLILDIRENSTDETDLVWRTVDDSKIIPVDVSKPIDTKLFKDYDACVTGSALKQFSNTPSWNDLVQNVWVYARVSPAQKEQILISLRSLGYITLMAGDGTNDVGALKAAHVGVALLDGSPEDLRAIAEHHRNERLKKIWQTQLNISQRLNQPPPPVPAPLAQIYPELVDIQKKALKDGQVARKENPMEKFNLSDITSKLADMEQDSEGPPQIKLGDASVAAPFTSKLSHVSAVSTIIRQGRCTLVATTQMYKILASNCLISAYSLSVQYLDGVKFGDYQMTIQGVCMSACFLCISRAKPVEKLSKERPQGSIFNTYVISTVLGQFSCHLLALMYVTQLCKKTSPRTTEINLQADFEPNLLNSAIYLLSTCQNVATFAVNFQGRPFREDIRENKPLFYGLLGAAAVAFCGATNFVPEANGWLQLVEMTTEFRFKLCLTMLLDFGGALLFEILSKFLFSDVKPREMVTRGSERREARRAKEESEELKRRQKVEEELAEKESDGYSNGLIEKVENKDGVDSNIRQRKNKK